jgi:hypothetical protein
MRLLPKDQDWTGYVWLVYLGYFLIIPWLIGAQTWVRVASVAGTLAALPMYFLGYWLRGRRVLWVVGGFTVLAVLFAPINPGGIERSMESIPMAGSSVGHHRSGSLAGAASTQLLDSGRVHDFADRVSGHTVGAPSAAHR